VISAIAWSKVSAFSGVIFAKYAAAVVGFFPARIASNSDPHSRGISSASISAQYLSEWLTFLAKWAPVAVSSN
jgi:hypothetical protein